MLAAPPSPAPRLYRVVTSQLALSAIFCTQQRLLETGTLESFTVWCSKGFRFTALFLPVSFHWLTVFFVQRAVQVNRTLVETHETGPTSRQGLLVAREA